MPKPGKHASSCSHGSSGSSSSSSDGTHGCAPISKPKPTPPYFWASRPATTQPIQNTSQEAEWLFDSTRDARDFRLTAKQCNTAFPGLFTEIDKAVSYRKTIGNVTPSDLDLSWQEDGGVRALIYDQQLYIIEARFGSDFQITRSLAILHAIHRAIITSPEPVPNIEFSFAAEDFADPDHLGKTVWALSRTSDQPEKWIMSDFGYWSWSVDLVGAYQEIRDQIAETERAWEEKERKLVWRGWTKNNARRKELLRITSGKDWADVQEVRWATATKVFSGDEGKVLKASEICQYQFVIQTEGRSYSGRGKYLQNCNSVVFMRRPTWIEPHHAVLSSSGPSQNYVEIKDDFSDLESKVLELLADQEKAKRIAENSVRTFRDGALTPAAQACYWRELFRGWAGVSFVPEGWVAGARGKRRGVPFETWM
ncbi:glycosyl transferase family 90-domain-containing protein [Bisporella sp. PMI_857]|nr:glycosyl transferase family 90-domain-containing protein [Bisporella sp. PMI_857]